MNLQFRVLWIQNFKAFAGPVTFSLKDCGPGLHFVRGRNRLEPSLHSNGAGKSSLWDALVWCLYGRTVANLRNPDIKPWSGDKETSVLLRLRCDENRHTIKRTTYPNRLLLDDRVVSQEQIDQLIGLSFETFTHTILMGQGRPLFFELQPRDKLELFTAVLNLDTWEQRSQKAADETRQCDDALIRLGHVERTSQDRLDQLKKQTEGIEQERDRWDQARTKDDQTSAARIQELQQEAASLQKDRDAADLAYDGAMTEIKAARLEQAQLRDYLEAAKEQRDAELRQLEIQKRELAKVRQQLDGADPELGSICESCGQPITGDGLVQHRRELKKRAKELAAAIEAGLTSAVNSQLTDLRQQLARNKEAALRFQEKADAANDRMIHLDPRLAQSKARLEQLQASKSKREREQNPFELQLSQLQAQRSATLDQLRDAKKEKEQTEKKRQRTAFWVKGFKEVRLFVIEDVLRELEIASNALLDQFGLHGWEIRYSIERETQSGNVSRALNVEIMSPHNPSPVKFESWSGGQQQRLRLIGSLALSDVLLERAGIRPSLEILDEPSRSITAHGVRDMVEALAERAAQRQTQIYYTDHAAIESSRFASSLCVTLGRTGARLSTDRELAYNAEDTDRGVRG